MAEGSLLVEPRDALVQGGAPSNPSGTVSRASERGRAPPRTVIMPWLAAVQLTILFVRAAIGGHHLRLHHVLRRDNVIHASTSAASPRAPSHHARENTSPAPDTSAPRPHTLHRPRCGRKHVRPAWCAV